MQTLMDVRARSGARERCGSALVACLIAVIGLAALCAGLLQMSGSASREMSVGADDLRALYVAEAGLAEAFYGLRTGKDGNVGSAEVPAKHATGVYWVEAEYLGDGAVALRSTGLCGRGRRSLELTVSVAEQSLASLGFFGGDEVELGADARIDAFDPDAGTYGEQRDSGGARVGSNGSVTLGDGAAVLGEVTPGAGGTVVLGSDSEVIGATTPADEEVELAVPEVPELVSSGSQTLAVGTSAVLADGASRYDALSLEPRSSLTVNGPYELVVEDLSLSPGATLQFDTSGGEIAVYVLGEATLEEGSILNGTGTDPRDLVIHLLGNNVDDGAGGGGPGGAAQEREFASSGEPADQLQVESTGVLFGHLFAPNGRLELPASLRVVGGAVARSLALADGATLTQDLRGLGDHRGTKSGLLVRCWNVRELPDLEIVRRRVDPFYLLASRGVDPIPSAEAHKLTLFRIGYIDTEGIPRTYRGPEALFDWDGVDQVLGVQREGDPTNDPTPWVDTSMPAPWGQERMAEGEGYWYPPEASRDSVTGDDWVPTSEDDLLSTLDAAASRSSSELRDSLLAASPLSPTILQRVIEESHEMNSSHVEKVLSVNAPLRDHTLVSATTQANLSSSEVCSILEENAPLSGEVVAAALARNPPLDASDLTKVMAIPLK
jgi:hypothetical protein